MDKKIVEDFIKELEKEQVRLQSRIYEIQSKGDERTVKEDDEMFRHEMLVGNIIPNAIKSTKFIMDKCKEESN